MQVEKFEVQVRWPNLIRSNYPHYSTTSHNPVVTDGHYPESRTKEYEKTSLELAICSILLIVLYSPVGLRAQKITRPQTYQDVPGYRSGPWQE
jgi:hypothetical protein